MQSVSQKIRTGLVEFRTSDGSLYAVPSFRERLYLLWIFRHFRSLSRPVLGPHQQKLIDKLWQTAEANKGRHIVRSSIIGAVENLGTMPARSAAAKESRVVEIAAANAKLSFATAVGSQALPLPQKVAEIAPTDSKQTSRKAKITEISIKRSASKTLDVPRPDAAGREKSTGRTWMEWGYGTALVVALVGVVFYVRELRPWSIAGTSRVQGSQATSAQSNLKSETHDVAPPNSHEGKGAALASAVPSPSIPAVDAPSGTHSTVSSRTEYTDRWPAPDKLVHITGAPAGGLTYPETPDAAATGIVNLKVLIAPDGTVKEVAVLSGNRALASSAVRAVRHWKYRSPEKNGEGAQAETLITFSFIGPDAVSISFPAHE